MSGYQVPSWLSHLRTDRRGIPVPWINLWGPEGDTERLSIRHDRHVGRPAVFYDDAGQTVPDFTRQHMARQREAMVTGLCQVCGRLVPSSRRFLVFADLSTDLVHVEGVGDVPVVTEPWLDERCARFAVTACPALIRRSRGDRLRLYQVRARDVTLILSVGSVDGPLEAESLRVMPVLWVKAAVKRAVQVAS
jgi:hypothetical protein